jgi:hypothetical protein
MIAEILLTERFQPLPLRGRRSEHLPGNLQRLVHQASLLGRHLEADARVLLFVVGSFPHGSLQAAHRFAPCPRDPPRLDFSARDRQHRFRLTQAHLAVAHRVPEQRPLPQPARQPCHLLRRARGDAQPLARIVADAGVVEAHRSIADRERVEPLPDGNVQRAAPPGHTHQKSVQLTNQRRGHCRIADALQPVEELRRSTQLRESRATGSRRAIYRFTHCSCLPPPSDNEW